MPRARTTAAGALARLPKWALTATVATSIVPATSRRLTARTWARSDRDFIEQRWGLDLISAKAGRVDNPRASPPPKLLIDRGDGQGCATTAIGCEVAAYTPAERR